MFNLTQEMRNSAKAAAGAPSSSSNPFMFINNDNNPQEKKKIQILESSGSMQSSSQVTEEKKEPTSSFSLFGATTTNPFNIPQSQEKFKLDKKVEPEQNSITGQETKSLFGGTGGLFQTKPQPSSSAQTTFQAQPFSFEIPKENSFLQPNQQSNQSLFGGPQVNMFSKPTLFDAPTDNQAFPKPNISIPPSFFSSKDDGKQKQPDKPERVLQFDGLFKQPEPASQVQGVVKLDIKSDLKLLTETNKRINDLDFLIEKRKNRQYILKESIEVDENMLRQKIKKEKKETIDLKGQLERQRITMEAKLKNLL